MEDDSYYLRAVREFNSGRLDEDLHSKAKELAAGDVYLQKPKYCELRVQQLKNLNRSENVLAPPNAGYGLEPIKSYIQSGRLIFVLKIAVVVVAGIIATVILLRSE